MNKNITLWVVVLALIALGIGGGYWYITSLSNNNQNSQSQMGAKGRIIFGITDAAGSMGNVSEVKVTVANTQIHSQTEGWVTVSSKTQEFELLALKQLGAISVLADTSVNAGTYDQMRLNISKVVVVESSGAEKEAKLPSGELKIMGQVVVNGDSTATAVFDFIVDESLHATGSGKFIFTPVIQLETRSDAMANIDSSSHVVISGGSAKKSNVGMDISGEVKNNFKVSPDATLDIVGNAIKLTTSGETNASVKITADAAMKTAVDGKYVDVVVSVTLGDQNGQKVWVVSGLKGLQLKKVIINATTGAIVTAP